MTVRQRSEDASPAADLIRQVLATSTGVIQGCETHICRDDDVEWIHQARVSTRRLRSALRAFGVLLEPLWVTMLLGELKWLGDRLGAVRDADVLLSHIESFAGRLLPEDRPALQGVLQPMRNRRRFEYDALVTAVRGDRYRLLLDRLIDAKEHTRLVPAARNFDRKKLVRLVRKPWRKLARAVERVGKHPSDVQLHHIRIQTKRFRYAAEAISPLVGDRARPLLERIARLQHVLGEAHDLTIERQRLLAPGSNSSEAFVAGEIAGVDTLSYAHARKAWRRAWRKASQKRLRFWARS